MKASIIEASTYLQPILIASLIFRQEKLDKNKVIGCIAGFAGVVIININQGGLNMSLSLMGEGFILLSTIAYAVSSVLIKIYSREDHPVMLSGWQFLLGGIIMILCGYLTGGSVHVDSAIYFHACLFISIRDLFLYLLKQPGLQSSSASVASEYPVSPVPRRRQQAFGLNPGRFIPRIP